MFLTALNELPRREIVLQQEVAERECKLWDGIRKESRLLKTEIVMLRDILVVLEWTTGESRL